MAFITLIPFIVADQGRLTLCMDFQEQQIPFTIAAHNALASGQTGWQWNAGLGTSFIHAYSFYLLGSVFFWISMLFPADMFPYMIGWLLMFKYAMAGMTSYLYLRRFVKNHRYAVIGAVLYAFSGFQASNILFYHFHDVVAIFPLMLLGLEIFITDGKRGYFAIAVALNCIVNYFFFPGEVLFSIVYYACRRLSVNNRLRECIVEVTALLGEGIMGTLTAGVLFVPNMLLSLGNPRMEASIYGREALVNSTSRYLAIIKGIFLPAENMDAHSIAVGVGPWISISAWLPAVGLVLVIAYTRKNNDWIKRLLTFSLVMTLCPLLGSAFYMFSSSYMRWWYMPILIMSLASVKVLEEREEYPIISSGFICGGVIILYYLYFVLIPWSMEQKSGITDKGKFYAGIIGAFFCVGIICVLNLLRKKNVIRRNIATGCIIFMIMFAAVLQTMRTAHGYRLADEKDYRTWKTEYDMAKELKQYDENYRFVRYDNLGSFIGGIHQCGSFSSTVSNAVIELNAAFGHNRMVEDQLDPVEITSWIGGKYYVSKELVEGAEEAVLDTISLNTEKRYVYELDSCPIAHSYRSYILRSEFDSLEGVDKGRAAVCFLVIPDDAEQEVIAYGLVHEDISAFLEYPTEFYQVGLKVAQEKMLNISKVESSGFVINGPFEDRSFAFAAIPADAGWSAYADGRSVKIYDICGLIAVPVDHSINELRFEYKTPGSVEGTAVSVIGVLMIILYIFHWKNKKNELQNNQKR